MFDKPAVAAVDVRGGAPGTRETDLLDAHRTVEAIDAVVLSGGSAFGLDAPSGVQAWLREQGRGFAIGDVTFRSCRARAVRHDQRRRQERGARFPPYRDLGYAARPRAGLGLRARHRGRGIRRDHGVSEGRARLGIGGDARRVHGRRDRRGERLRQRQRRRQPAFLGGAVRDRHAEFGGHGFPAKVPPEALVPHAKGQPGENTTIALVATDAMLTKAQAQQIA